MSIITMSWPQCGGPLVNAHADVWACPTCGVTYEVGGGDLLLPWPTSGRVALVDGSSVSSASRPEERAGPLR